MMHLRALVGGFLLFFILTTTIGRAEPSPPPASPPAPSPSPTATIPPVNPYGPTVAVTAALTNVGIPEFEQFYFSSRGVTGASQLRQTPFLIKYTFDNRWQV